MNKLLLTTIVALSSALTHAAPVNLTEPDVGWSKKEVRVCFADSSHLFKSRLYEKGVEQASLLPFTKAQKAAIKTVITQEYTLNRTGISYTGWKDCKQDPKSDAYLFRVIDPTISFSGSATMGESGKISFIDQGPESKIVRAYRKDKEEASKPYVALNTNVMTGEGASPIEHLQLAAVHEFGHLSGLDHEHMDIDPENQRYPDRNCDATGILIKESEIPYFSTKKVSVYDTNSVMNYCFIEILKSSSPSFIIAEKDVALFDFQDSSLITSKPDPDGIHFEVKIGLSQGDVHALKCLYVYSEDIRNQICVPTFDPKLPQ